MRINWSMCRLTATKAVVRCAAYAAYGWRTAKYHLEQKLKYGWVRIGTEDEPLE